MHHNHLRTIRDSRRSRHKILIKVTTLLHWHPHKVLNIYHMCLQEVVTISGRRSLRLHH